MFFPKTKRIKNREFLDFIKSQPCCVCGKGPSDPDHVKTQGSGGGDVAGNVWPLCRQHHTERHMIGLYTFLKKYPHAEEFLKRWKS